MVADRWIYRLERLGVSVAGKERKTKRKHRKENPTADTLLFM